MAKSITALRKQPSLRDQVSAAEWETRVDLAAAFRVGHHLGWNDTVLNHIVARIPDQPDRFLMNAQLSWDEMTASNLLKLTLDGRIVSDTDQRPGPAGLNFHSAILRAKPHVGCSLHIHPLDGVTVSALQEGLMFYDQGSCALYGEMTYHDFEGLAQEAEEAPRIIAELGDRHAMMMRNHGLLTVGRDVGEAFVYMARLVAACATQVRIMSTNGTPRPLSKEICEYTWKQMQGRNEPVGNRQWAAYRRLAERLDPGFAA